MRFLGLLPPFALGSACQCGGRGWMVCTSREGADVIYSSCSSYIFPVKRRGTCCVSVYQIVSSEKLILWCHGELHWHSMSVLPSSPTLLCTCMHIHILSLSSVNPFPCNYAPWLFVSVFFHKLPTEMRVEKPIACSQQIKEARTLSCDVVSLLYLLQDRRRLRVHRWVREQETRLSLFPYSPHYCTASVHSVWKRTVI